MQDPLVTVREAFEDGARLRQEFVGAMGARVVEAADRITASRLERVCAPD